MAEVKNAFIKSKMNKDLDARLIPQGEYRDAVNVQVSKSEGDDVGALENVLGNFSVAEFEPTVSDLTCIGFLVNEFNSTVYLFFTDYTDDYESNGGNPTYNPDAKNFIYQYNTLSSNSNKLVEGAFLNFSKNRPIIGINILEEFLFFTDNRNQPRKINVTRALDNNQYYQTEDQISVAKYNPYQPIYLWKTSELEAAETAIPTVVGNVTDSFVIEIESAIDWDISVGQGVVGKGGSVIKPYTYVEAVNGTTITLSKAQTLSDGDSIAFVDLETSMYDVANKFLPNGTTNPYYREDEQGESLFAGDPKFLEDKFVRFSYRFKFDDGEYSLLAPFTQPCFIPKQDGYFTEGDEQQAVASTILSFMENKVNQIDLQIPLPTAGNLLSSELKIAELEIVYKESDALALQSIDIIQVASISSSAGENNVFEYTYNSTKPFKTLPANEITRVYDKIPVKAFGQEIISNRVVYSNFQDKHTPPAALTYQVAASEKYDFNTGESIFSSKTTIEYPNHSVKENRNYQVGVVLSDRYGRQSTVILSNDDSDKNNEFGADTVYIPYDDSDVYNPTTFLGNSIKVLFNSFITSDKNEVFGRPGLYNGDATSSAYNPLGWYSYKIVIKQIEQEYYNVYAAGAMKGNPIQPNSETNTSFITVINDNINKIPRDLSEVGPQDKTFRSSVRLFGRVVNTIRSFNNQGNKQYQPEQTGLSFTTNNIEDLYDLFDIAGYNETENKPITDPTNKFHAFYKAESNPFIAEFVTSQLDADKFGIRNTVSSQANEYPKNENLIILETNPTVSNIDIFFESSTAGLISELNIAIDTDGAFATEGFQYTHDESYDIGADVTLDFQFKDVLNEIVVPTATPVLSVLDNTGVDRSSDFSIFVVDDVAGIYKIKTASYFYYGQNAINLESYTFTFTVTVGEAITDVTESGALTNVPPIILNDNTPDINVDQGAREIPLPFTPDSAGGIDAVNGSNIAGGRSKEDLIYQISSQTGNGVFELQGLSVVNTDPNAIGRGSFELLVADVSRGEYKTFNVNFGQPPVTAAFNSESPSFIYDADGQADFYASENKALTSNTPAYLSSYLTGFQAPTPPDTFLAAPVCPTGSTLDANFYNIFYETGLTQGTFFVYINPENFDQTTINLNRFSTLVIWSVQYRANSSSNWSDAVDINNVIPEKYGKWYYDEDSGVIGMQAYGQGFGGELGINSEIISSTQGQTPSFSGRVLAFNLVGEYRVIFGNLASNYTAPDAPGNTAPAYRIGGSADCSQNQNPNISAQYWTQDFYKPGTNFAPDADPNTPNVYRYQIATNSSSSTDFVSDGVNYYAAEPFANYITQLYLDEALTQKASFTTGGDRRYRRMDRISPSSTRVFNPEFTKDGSYVAYFNSTGLRDTSPDNIPFPSLYSFN